MIGRASIMVDSDTISEYRSVYCQTLDVIREQIYDGLGQVPGVSSTSLLLGGRGAPQICDFDRPEIVDDPPDPNNTVDQEPAATASTSPEFHIHRGSGSQSVGIVLTVFGLIGVVSGLLVAVAIRSRRGRRAKQRRQEDSVAEEDDQSHPYDEEDIESFSPSTTSAKLGGPPAALASADSDLFDPYLSSPSTVNHSGLGATEERDPPVAGSNFSVKVTVTPGADGRNP